VLRNLVATKGMCWSLTGVGSCDGVDAQPDITLCELQARLAKERVVVSQTAIFRFLRHLEFTF
jgi:hypothetical protein